MRDDSHCWINKTAVLEQAIGRFPALYIEGAAASGKSIAMQMLLERHPKVRGQIFWMDQKTVRRAVLEKLKQWKLSLEQETADGGCELQMEGSRCESQVTDTGCESQFADSGCESQIREPYWFVFESMPSGMAEELAQSLAAFVREIPECWKVIFISREQPPEAFLDLIWKRQMEIIPQRELLLSLEEVREMTGYADSPLQPEELYQITGGWAGCVDVMLRLAESECLKSGHGKVAQEQISVRELRGRYEVDTYIRKEILDTLSEAEKKILELGMVCPWINESICQEMLADMVVKLNSMSQEDRISEIDIVPEPVIGSKHDTVHTVLKGLERKGLLISDIRKKRWKAAPLFVCVEHQNIKDIVCVKTLENWYEQHGFLKEALWFCKHFLTEKEYCDCLIRHYDKVPFLEISYTELLKYRVHSPKAAYLRGMCYRMSGDFQKMSQEAAAISPKYPELYLNLTFANPEMPLDEWLELADNLSQIQRKFSLFDILDSSHTYLCGIRDLSDLFACTKKEENRKAQIWKRVFGEAEWRAYCLARIDYYLETERGKKLLEEDEKLLDQLLQAEVHRNSSRREPRWKNGIAGLYLHCHLQMIQPDEEKKSRILQLAETLLRIDDPVCVHNTEAIMGIFASVLDRRENFGNWLLNSENRKEIQNKNDFRFDWFQNEFSGLQMTGTELMFQIGGYLRLHQYGRADRLLQRAIPLLKKYHMTSLYAQALFQQAVVKWCMEEHGQALQNVISSFLVNGSSRYVEFYTFYGSAGVEVLEAYVEWMQKSIPGGWNRKKKYNYGNVLRMPVEDYMEVILRKAKCAARKGDSAKALDQGEALTMMETIVLQAICQGLSNAEISKQQNLKITTVKSHIYSVYKKLGVGSRMQAALKGKELGIV